MPFGSVNKECLNEKQTFFLAGSARIAVLMRFLLGGAKKKLNFDVRAGLPDFSW
jgi:hypothetical protein